MAKKQDKRMSKKPRSQIEAYEKQTAHLHNDLEPLREDLRRFVDKTNSIPKLGGLIRHPFYVGFVDLNRAAWVHYTIDKKQEILDRMIEEGKWDEALLIYEKPFRLDGFLKYINRYDDASYWRLLADV